MTRIDFELLWEPSWAWRRHRRARNQVHWDTLWCFFSSTWGYPCKDLGNRDQVHHWNIHLLQLLKQNSHSCPFEHLFVTLRPLKSFSEDPANQEGLKLLKTVVCEAKCSSVGRFDWSSRCFTGTVDISWFEHRCCAPQNGFSWSYSSHQGYHQEMQGKSRLCSRL